MKRSLAAIDEIVKANPDKTVVVGTHGGVIRVLLAAWTKCSFDEIKNIPHVPNPSLAEVDFKNGKAELVSIGDNSYLSEKVTEAGLK